MTDEEYRKVEQELEEELHRKEVWEMEDQIGEANATRFFSLIGRMDDLKTDVGRREQATRALATYLKQNLDGVLPNLVAIIEELSQNSKLLNGHQEGFQSLKTEIEEEIWSYRKNSGEDVEEIASSQLKNMEYHLNELERFVRPYGDPADLRQ